MRAKPHTCTGCPAEHYGIGFVPPTTPPLVRWVVVGQGPGEQEVLFEESFYPQAPSGRMLRGWLAEAGIPEDQVSFGNVVWCWLPKTRINHELGKGSREPTAAEAEHCWRVHTKPWLEALPPTAPLLAVGAPAARKLLGLEPGASTENLTGITHYQEIPS
jgi:uracil-DNA glycosylase family 4